MRLQQMFRRLTGLHTFDGGKRSVANPATAHLSV
jgi:hypothetical protein